MTQTLLEKPHSIAFIDLKAQQAQIRTQIDAAIKRVLDHGQYILGPEVTELEHKLAEFCGAKHVITCANGTDALVLSLMAKQVGSGDAVFVPSFTFAATAEAVALCGAQPVFIDVLSDSFNIDPQSLELGIQTAVNASLRPAGIIAVDLFGQPANYAAMQDIANKHNLWIIADGAQSFGAEYHGKKVGNIVDLTTTSFFPAKPFGCYGDGGAIFTNDDATAALLHSLRVHGQGKDKYHNTYVGMNSRLDSIQAAILLEKLKIFPQELKQRQKIADQYNFLLSKHAIVPKLAPNVTSAWAQYTLRIAPNLRPELIKHLQKQNIPVAIYYSLPLHLQAAYKKYLTATPTLPVCEKLSQSVLSIPMHSYLNTTDIEYITEFIRQMPRRGFK